MLPEVRRDATALPPNTAVCMGAFDGLHRGHQALIDRARTHSPAVTLVTFDPHPAQVTAPSRAPRLLHAPIQRQRVAGALGVAQLVLLPFDREMAALSPAAFVQKYLGDGLRPQAVVVGSDFRFGAQRRGTASMLRDELAPFGIDVELVEPVPLPSLGGKLSSTDIRRALEAGDVTTAGALLGRWHALAGGVVHGAKRGRDLGFPTANLGPSASFAPLVGIYATVLSVWSRGAADYGAVWPAVTSVGRNPTFVPTNATAQPPVVIETHVLDHPLGERLYGLDVEVAFVKRLRAEAKFDTPEALVDQMRRDADQARSTVTPEVLARVLRPPVAPAAAEASPPPQPGPQPHSGVAAAHGPDAVPPHTPDAQ